MNKEKYESLKKVDFHESENYILDAIRDINLQNDELLSYEVGISALARILKETKNQKTLVDFLDNHIIDETTRIFLKKMAKKFFKLIELISEKFCKDELEALVLFSEPRLFSVISENSTPTGISRLAINLLELQENDVVLDLGSGVSSFLMEAALDSESKNFYGVEINTSNVITANIRRFVSDLPIKVIQGNIISQDFTHLQANKIFSNFPLGMKLSDIRNYMNKNNNLKQYFKNAKRTISPDWIYTMAAYLNMKKPGKTVVLMSNAGACNKPDEELRQKLVEDGIIEGVILLPPRLLSYTATPLIMMILSQDNEKIKIVDASEIYTEGRRQNSLETKDIERIIDAYHNDSDISKKVTVKDVAKQEYILNPQRYIGTYVEIANGISLGEVSKSINRGAMIRSTELDTMMSKEETNYHYLMLQNINDGFIDSKLPSLIGIDEKYKKYCINNRNLIISKTFPFKVALAYVKEDEYILANGNLYFIELDETKVNPLFVSIFMQSEAGIAQLNRYAKGNIVKSISIQDLKKIIIPNLPREQQDQIAQEYENLNDELNVLQRQIDMVRDKKARLLEGVI